jgi:hypothetical protein
MASPDLAAQDVTDALDSFYCHDVVAALWADAVANRLAITTYALQRINIIISIYQATTQSGLNSSNPEHPQTPDTSRADVLAAQASEQAWNAAAAAVPPGSPAGRSPFSGGGQPVE